MEKRKMENGKRKINIIRGRRRAGEEASHDPQNDIDATIVTPTTASTLSPHPPSPIHHLLGLSAGCAAADRKVQMSHIKLTLVDPTTTTTKLFEA